MWHKVVFSREDLWCPVIPCINRACADFGKGILVGPEGSSNDINAQIKLGDIVELSEFPSGSFLVFRLVEYPMDEIQYVHVFNVEIRQAEPFCVKPHLIKNILGNMNDSWSLSKSLVEMIRGLRDDDKIINLVTKWEHYTTDERHDFSKRYIIEKVKAAQIRQVPDVDDLIQSTKEIYLPEKLVAMALLQSPQQKEKELSQLPAEGVAKKRYSSRTATIPSAAARTRRLKVFPNDMYGPERYTAAVITGPSGDVEGTISLGDVALINFREGEGDTEGESLSSVFGTVYRITDAGISLLEHGVAGSGVPEFTVVKGVAPDSIVRTGKGKAFFSGAEGAGRELGRAKRFLCDEKGEPELWRWVSECDELGAVARSELMAQLRRATRRRLRERRAAAAAGAGKGRKRPRELRLPREPEKKKRFFPLMVGEGMTLATKPEKGQDGIIGEVNRLLERVATEERWDADMDGYDSSTGAPRNASKKKARNGYRTIDSGSESDSWSEDDSDAESGKEGMAKKYSKKDKKDDKKENAYKREDTKADKVEDKNEGSNTEGQEGNEGNDGKEETNDDTETETETDTETESESDTDTDAEGDSVANKEGDDNENENEDEDITENENVIVNLNENEIEE